MGTVLLSSIVVFLVGLLIKCRDASDLKGLNLLSWNGQIERRPYLVWGLILFCFKHNLDRYVYYHFYHRYNWQLFDYLYPVSHIGQNPLTQSDIKFFTAIFLIAIPFIYIGTGLTLKRLRALGLPLWLTVFFFVPIVNFLFFLILIILPSQQIKSSSFTLRDRSPFQNILDRIIPDSPLGSAIAAILISSVLAFFGVLLGVTVLKNYGISLFVAGPCVPRGTFTSNFGEPLPLISANLYQQFR